MFPAGIDNPLLIAMILLEAIVVGIFPVILRFIDDVASRQLMQEQRYGPGVDLGRFQPPISKVIYSMGSRQ